MPQTITEQACPAAAPGRRAIIAMLAGGAALGAYPAMLRAQARAPLIVRAGITGSSFTQDERDYPTRRLEDLTDFRPGPAPRLTRFGGEAKGARRGTGFFRVTRERGRWWLCDPAGGRFFSIGMNSTAPQRRGSAAAAYRERFGSDARWAEGTAALFRATGINSAGAWSDPVSLALSPERVGYCSNWSFLSTFGKSLGRTSQQAGHVGFAHDAPPVFHPDFPAFCERHAAKLDASARDPWLIGHFTDNELPFGLKMLDAFLAAPADDSARLAATAWLGARDPAAIDDAQRDAFRAHVIDRYYAVVTAAIRRHDPNHLILGTRFYGSEKDSEAAFRASGRYVDAVSVNVYHEWSPNTARMQRWAQWSSRPVIVSEFYAKGADAGLNNRGGAGWTVATQAERGLFYQNFVLGLIESGVCVGWHWHRYIDNDPVDTTTDASNRGSNKGIVSIVYAPYAPLVDAMRALNAQTFTLADHFDRR